MINTYYCSNNIHISEASFSLLLNCVSAERRKKIIHIRNLEDKKNSLISELLIRYVLRSEYDIKEDTLFDKSVNGKPFLKNHSNLHFNISHSGNFIVCAFSNNLVGIDIELLRDIDTAISSHYLNDREINSFHPVNNNSFFKLWTAKESILKLTGEGFRANPKDVDIIEEDNKYFAHYKNRIFCLHSHFIENHFISIASIDNSKIRDIQLIDIQEMLSFFINKAE